MKVVLRGMGMLRINLASKKNKVTSCRLLKCTFIKSAFPSFIISLQPPLYHTRCQCSINGDVYNCDIFASSRCTLAPSCPVASVGGTTGSCCPSWPTPCARSGPTKACERPRPEATSLSWTTLPSSEYNDLWWSTLHKATVKPVLRISHLQERCPVTFEESEA